MSPNVIGTRVWACTGIAVRANRSNPTSPQRQQGRAGLRKRPETFPAVLSMMHLAYLHVGGQIQAGFLDGGEQLADDGEGIHLIEPGLVIEDQAMIEYGSG